MAAQSRLSTAVTQPIAPFGYSIDDKLTVPSQQISEAVNALGAVAQGEARRGLRNARANVDSLMSDASDRAAAQDARLRSATRWRT
jgi:hypothetical protein